MGVRQERRGSKGEGNSIGVTSKSVYIVIRTYRCCSQVDTNGTAQLSGTYALNAHCANRENTCNSLHLLLLHDPNRTSDGTNVKECKSEETGEGIRHGAGRPATFHVFLVMLHFFPPRISSHTSTSFNQSVHKLDQFIKHSLLNSVSFPS